MNIKRVTSALLALCAVSTIASAWAQTPTVEARIEQDSVGIGDRFTYSIIVERDQVQVVEFPEFSTKDGDMVEFIEASPIDTLEQDGRRLKLRRQYTLTTFEDGEINLGVAKVLYLDKNIADTLYSKDSLRLVVNTFHIDSTSQSIYDLKAQRAMPFKFDEVKGYAKWTILALIILAVIIYFISRALAARGKRLRDIFKATPPPPPHIEAIKALEELHNQKLWQNEKYKEYYSMLSNILRHYIARRYGVAAMEMTSEEIIVAMKSVELPSKSSMDLTSLLREADLVKFAKATPEGEENEAHYLRAYYFIEETKIQEEIDPNAEEELFDVNGGGQTN
ncbi:MAG: hypothetical protein SNF69_05475 [Rikenellaceae bacterium]